MSKFLFVATMLGALSCVGFDTQEAQAGTPFFLSIGGPRGVNVATGGHRYGGGARGFGGYGRYGGGQRYGHGMHHNVGYGGYGGGLHGRYVAPRGHFHAPPRRSCGYGY